MKPIKKSQINLSEFFSFAMIFGLLYSIIWIFCDQHFVHIAIIISAPFLLYTPLFLWANQYYFYDDCLRVVYKFRFAQKTKEYSYSDIEIAKYMNNGGKGNRAWIVLVFKGKQFSKIFRSSTSFTHYSYTKRKELLLFLKHKNVPIEVNSIFKKDNGILQ